MKTQHTPGPWHRGCSTLAGGVQIVTADKNDEPNGLIAVVNAKHTIEPGKAISDEVRANAVIIAAAPELLAALQTIQNILAQSIPIDYKRDCFESLKIANAAIAKATGAQS